MYLNTRYLSFSENTEAQHKNQMAIEAQGMFQMVRYHTAISAHFRLTYRINYIYTRAWKLAYRLCKERTVIITEFPAARNPHRFKGMPTRHTFEMYAARAFPIHFHSLYYPCFH